MEKGRDSQLKASEKTDGNMRRRSNKETGQTNDGSSYVGMWFPKNDSMKQSILVVYGR